LEEINGVPIVHQIKLNHHQSSKKTSKVQLVEIVNTLPRQISGKTFILKSHSSTVKFSSQKIIKKCSAPTAVNPIATK